MFLFDYELLNKLRDQAEKRSFTPNQKSYRKRLVTKVQNLMGWDAAKTETWFTVKNPNLGETSPDTMIKMGRGHKVHAFIQSAIEESQP